MRSWSLHKISASVLSLKGVGPKHAENLKRLSIFTVQDVLFHLPFRYEDRTKISVIGALQAGQQACVEATVDFADIGFRRSGRSRRVLLVRVSDGTGSLTLRFFHFTAAQKKTYEQGVKLRCFGECKAGKLGLEIIHPEVSIITEQTKAMEQSLTPVYPVTDGLHQLSLRNISQQALLALDSGDCKINEWLPNDIIQQYQYPGLTESLRFLHRPPPDADIEQLMSGLHPAQRRLSFEELLAHQLSFLKARHKQQSHAAEPLPIECPLKEAFIHDLLFDLTAAQKKVIDECVKDMSAAKPMLRLLQGDVGSGKTVVAACVCLQALQQGFQAAIMAPTEILAEQHLANFSAWFKDADFQIAFLSGKLKAAERKQQLENIRCGHAKLIIGTHALFQEEVEFDHLAVAVIDEQHRFGVHQRLALRQKGVTKGIVPHQLIMTATPIPRSLAMTAYADLDYSVIDELPPGRTAVTTVVMSEARRPDIVERVQAACKDGKQVYWVCTLVEESDALQCEAAEITAEKLREALPDLSIGLIHGRMKPDEKKSVMASFKNRDTQLLIATTVIEVGVDVPNASLMIIENAERLGLSQIHQLRGRVGRGDVKSSCVLMYKPPLSEKAQSRLSIMRETNDGFEIAEKDLQMRGPGELLGAKQAGAIQFHLADLQRDVDLLDAVKTAAVVMLKDYPDHVEPLVRRWLGNIEDYSNA